MLQYKHCCIGTIYGIVDHAAKDSLSPVDISNLDNLSPSINYFEGVVNPLLNHTSTKYSILVIPSIYGEGFPRAALEAMSIGIPVLLTRSAASDSIPQELVFISNDNTVDELSKPLEKFFIECQQDDLVRVRRESARTFALSLLRVILLTKL